MVTCAKCHGSTDDSKDFHRVVSISGGVMGDEYIESLYYCNKCECYTVEVYRDRFDGPDSEFIRGPLSRKDGEALVTLISQCERPYDKKCRCPAHREYFGSWLD